MSKLHCTLCGAALVAYLAGAALVGMAGGNENCTRLAENGREALTTLCEDCERAEKLAEDMANFVEDDARHILIAVPNR